MTYNWDKFKESFEKFVVLDLKKALEANVEVGVIILTAIGIECLSGYFTGKNTDCKTFKRFIDRFMPNYSPHAITLYKCVRNGLAHNYIIKEHEEQSFLFTGKKEGKHLIPVANKNGWFYLNREQFAIDFLEAQKDFFQNVETDENLRKIATSYLIDKGFLDVFSCLSDIIFIDSNADTSEYDGATGTIVNKYQSDQIILN